MRMTGSGPNLASSSSGGRLAGMLQAGTPQRWVRFGRRRGVPRNCRSKGSESWQRRVLLGGGVLRILGLLRSRRPPEPGWSAGLLLGLESGGDLAADDEGRQYQLVDSGAVDFFDDAHACIAVLTFQHVDRENPLHQVRPTHSCWPGRSRRNPRLFRVGRDGHDSTAERVAGSEEPVEDPHVHSRRGNQRRKTRYEGDTFVHERVDAVFPGAFQVERHLAIVAEANALRGYGRPSHVPQETLQPVPLVRLYRAPRMELEAIDSGQQLWLFAGRGRWGSAPQGVPLASAAAGLLVARNPLVLGRGLGALEEKLGGLGEARVCPGFCGAGLVGRRAVARVTEQASTSEKAVNSAGDAMGDGFQVQGPRRGGLEEGRRTTGHLVVDAIQKRRMTVWPEVDPTTRPCRWVGARSCGSTTRFIPFTTVTSRSFGARAGRTVRFWCGPRTAPT